MSFRWVVPIGYCQLLRRVVVKNIISNTLSTQFSFYGTFFPGVVHWFIDLLFQYNNYKNRSNNNFLTVLLTSALAWVKVNIILCNQVFHGPALFQKLPVRICHSKKIMILNAAEKMILSWEIIVLKLGSQWKRTTKMALFLDMLNMSNIIFLTYVKQSWE